MTDVVGIGARMAAARAKKQASQVKAAAMLEISDKSYKNYEAEKRELPLAVAVGFCEAFDVELEWLVYGTQANAGEKENTNPMCTKKRENFLHTVKYSALYGIWYV